MEEVNQALEALPPVLTEIEETRRMIPEVLAEIRASREAIGSAMETIRQTEARIPQVLAESEQIRTELPRALESIDKASDAVAGFTGELGEVRAVMPEILEELEKTREALPPLLDQAERIASQGGKFGQEAGKGVVTGLISLLNPINLTLQLKDLVLPGKDIRGLTAGDIEALREKTLQAIESGQAGTVAEWADPNSRNRGKITVGREFTENSVQCKEIRTEIWIGGDKSHDFKVVFCRQPDGSWIKK